MPTSHLIQLAPGRRSVAINAEPEDHPEHVDIWLGWLTREAD